jgi:hypothetical protein
MESGKRSWKIGQPYGSLIDLTLTVQYGRVQYSTVQCSAVQCSAERSFTALHSTVQYTTERAVQNVRYGTALHRMYSKSAAQRSTAQYSTAQHSTVTVQCSAVQYPHLGASISTLVQASDTINIPPPSPSKLGRKREMLGV